MGHLIKTRVQGMLQISKAGEMTHGIDAPCFRLLHEHFKDRRVRDVLYLQKRGLTIGD